MMIYNEKKLSSIQALRGLAAILVVFCHSEQYASDFLSVRMKSYLGQSFGFFGVDIFFVISGFIMVYINQNNFGDYKTILPFLKRRLIRIVPIYWLVTLVVLTVILPSKLYTFSMPQPEQFLTDAIKNFHYIINNFLLFPTFDDGGKSLPPIIAVSWTLMYEMLFYYIFTFVLLFKKPLFLIILTLLFTILFFLKFVFMYAKVSPHFPLYNQIIFYGNDVIFEFLFGCFLASLYFSGKILSTWTSFLFIGVAICMFVFSYHIPMKHFFELRNFEILSVVYHVRALGYGVPAFLLVYGILSLETKHTINIPQLLVKIGDASYSIYLIHLAIVLGVLFAILKKINMFVSIPGDAAVLFIWIICILLGCLNYKYVEMPLINWIKNLKIMIVSDQKQAERL